MCLLPIAGRDGEAIGGGDIGDEHSGLKGAAGLGPEGGGTAGVGACVFHPPIIDRAETQARRSPISGGKSLESHEAERGLAGAGARNSRVVAAGDRS